MTDANLPGNGQCGRSGIAGDHLDLDTQICQLSDELSRVRARAVAQPEQSSQPQLATGSHGHGKHPVSLGRQSILLLR